MRGSKRRSGGHPLFAPMRLRMELDPIPLWRGDHVPVKHLYDELGTVRLGHDSPSHLLRCCCADRAIRCGTVGFDVPPVARVSRAYRRTGDGARVGRRRARTADAGRARRLPCAIARIRSRDVDWRLNNFQTVPVNLTPKASKTSVGIRRLRGFSVSKSRYFAAEIVRAPARIGGIRGV